MKKNTARILALVVLTTACLALPAAAIARPDAVDPAVERADPGRNLPEIVRSIFDKLRAVVKGVIPQTGEQDQMPGSSMDPDGNRPIHR